MTVNSWVQIFKFKVQKFWFSRFCCFCWFISLYYHCFIVSHVVIGSIYFVILVFGSFCFSLLRTLSTFLSKLPGFSSHCSPVITAFCSSPLLTFASLVNFVDIFHSAYPTAIYSWSPWTRYASAECLAIFWDRLSIIHRPSVSFAFIWLAFLFSLTMTSFTSSWFLVGYFFIVSCWDRLWAILYVLRATFSGVLSPLFCPSIFSFTL